MLSKRSRTRSGFTKYVGQTPRDNSILTLHFHLISLRQLKCVLGTSTFLVLRLFILTTPMYCQSRLSQFWSAFQLSGRCLRLYSRAIIQVVEYFQTLEEEVSSNQPTFFLSDIQLKSARQIRHVWKLKTKTSLANILFFANRYVAPINIALAIYSES